MRALRSALRGLGLVVAALVALDLLVGWVLLDDGAFRGRPLPPFDALTDPDQRDWLARLAAPDSELERDVRGRARNVGRFDPVLGWAMREDSYDGERYSVGATGARGPREYTEAKPEGVLRVLCFGDSYVFCDEVLDKNAWPAKLEQRRPRVEALNFGVGAYGTDQALLRFRELAPRFAPDAVVVGLVPENVGRNVNRYRPLWFPATSFAGVKPRFVLGADGALELVPQPYPTKQALAAAIESGRVLEDVAEHEHWLGRPSWPRWTGYSSILRLAWGALWYGARDPHDLVADPDGEPVRVTLAILEAFRTEARELGAEGLLVVVFPWRQDLREFADTGERWWQPLLDELGRRDFDVLDVATHLLPQQRRIDSGEVEGSLHGGGHLSAWGTEIVAQEVDAWLVGLLQGAEGGG